jgi:uncharacterized protein
MKESLIKRHYDALGQGRLLAHRCEKCGGYTFPMTTACEHCGSASSVEVVLSGRGKVHFASHNIAPATHPRFADLAPYVYGHIILEEGVVTQGILRNVVATPEAVRALFERGPTGVTLDVLPTADLPVIAFKVV